MLQCYIHISQPYHIFMCANDNVISHLYQYRPEGQHAFHLNAMQYQVFFSVSHMGCISIAFNAPQCMIMEFMRSRYESTNRLLEDNFFHVISFSSLCKCSRLAKFLM